MLFYVSVLLQEVPNEVLQVGNSLRTLDLTNNKLGNQILFVPVCYIQLSMDISQVQKEFYVLLIFNVSVLKGGPGASGRVLPPVTGRSRVRVAVSSHCTGEGKDCH